ncbi:hypothetical protein Droror1_Dr00017485 [Drosera rotundifolia]
MVIRRNPSHFQGLLCTSVLVIGIVQNGIRFVSSVFYHSSESTYKEVLPSRWYEEVFPKLSKLSCVLRNVDLVDGRLIDVNENSIVRDEGMLRRMLNFKAIGRVFLGAPGVQEEFRRNMEATLTDRYCEFPVYFSRSCARRPLVVSSLKPVSEFLGISAQQRKVLRLSVCSQVARHNIWISALEEFLNGLKFEMEYLKCHSPRKGIHIGEQIVSSCLSFLSRTANCRDLEAASWMRPKPIRVVDCQSTHKWEEVLEMFNDLINCLRDEKELAFYVYNLEVMREGLTQIKDLSVDKNIAYKEARHQESLVHKRLVKTLGHSSKCLFTLLHYYLYGAMGDMEIEVLGDLHQAGARDKFCLCMGKVMTSDEENMIRSGMKQLHRNLGLFKFAWETSQMKGNLELQGHIWCVGAQYRTLTYKGTSFFVHGINL